LNLNSKLKRVFKKNKGKRENKINKKEIKRPSPSLSPGGPPSSPSVGAPSPNPRARARPSRRRLCAGPMRHPSQGTISPAQASHVFPNRPCAAPLSLPLPLSPSLSLAAVPCSPPGRHAFFLPPPHTVCGVTMARGARRPTARAHDPPRRRERVASVRPASARLRRGRAATARARGPEAGSVARGAARGHGVASLPDAAARGQPARPLPGAEAHRPDSAVARGHPSPTGWRGAWP
jgi:hypothetical protein